MILAIHSMQGKLYWATVSQPKEWMFMEGGVIDPPSCSIESVYRAVTEELHFGGIVSAILAVHTSTGCAQRFYSVVYTLLGAPNFIEFNLLNVEEEVVLNIEKDLDPSLKRLVYGAISKYKEVQHV